MGIEGRSERHPSAAPDPVGALDSEGRVAYADDALARLLGHGAGDVGRVRLPDLLHADDRAFVETELASLARQGVVATFRARCIRDGGTWQQVVVSVSPPGDDGLAVFTAREDATADGAGAGDRGDPILDCRRAMRRTPAMVWTTDADLRVTSLFTPGYPAHNGLTRLLGTPLQEFFGTSDEAFLPLQAARKALAGEHVGYEMSWEDHTYRCQVEPLLSPDGDVYGTFSMGLDITDRLEIEARLSRHERLLRGVSEIGNALLSAGDRDDAIDTALAIAGQACDVDRVYLYEIHADAETGEMLGSERYEWVRPGVTAHIDDPTHRNVPVEEGGFGAWVPLARQGHVIQARPADLPEAAGAMLLDSDVKSLVLVPILVGGELAGCVGFDDCHSERLWEASEIALLQTMASDVAAAMEREWVEDRITHQAYYDPLTRLPNRLLFNDRIEQALLHARRHDSRMAVFFLDLDRFKLINETLGHTHGDAFLKAVAERLVGALSSEDTVARLSGDEFAVLLPDVRDLQGVLSAAEAIQTAFHQPIVFYDREFYANFSIGISLYPEDGRYPSNLLMNAESAMHSVKREGGHRYKLYSPSMNAETFKRLVLESDLRQAIASKAFEVFFQPQVSLGAGEVVGMEALVRWRHPGLGLVMPGEFIPFSEDTGLICELGELVLRMSCTQVQEWNRRLERPISVAVNISPVQFRDERLLAGIDAVLGEVGLDPGWLELELTERVLLEDADSAVLMMHALKQLGVRLTLDDFGVGYSSMNYLKRLPIDTIKIDRTFVRDLLSDPADAAICRSIIGLGASLGFRVVAEGIETREQLEFLALEGCSVGQGYIFSHPLPVEAASGLLLESESDHLRRMRP